MVLAEITSWLGRELYTQQENESLLLCVWSSERPTLTASLSTLLLIGDIIFRKNTLFLTTKLTTVLQLPAGHWLMFEDVETNICTDILD